MASWYYADRNRQRRGPVEDAELVRQFHQGEIALNSLVWRDGLGEWQPLRDFSDELALHQAPTETFYAAPGPVAAPAAAGAADSPYAPPAAALTSEDALHAGGEVVHAGFWKRFAASTIDGLLVGVAMLIVLVIGAAVLGVGMSTIASDVASGTIGVFLIVGIYLVPIALQAVYFTWMHASSQQATLGKRAVTVKVVRSDGRRISTGRSLARFCAYFFMHLFSCGITSLASAFMIGLGQRKQGLHDLVADTLVVDRWAFTANPERQRHELGPVTVAMIVLAALLAVGYVIMLFVIGAMAGRGAQGGGF
jgi:uncharacterized RDD family membrane protein YckC